MQFPDVGKGRGTAGRRLDTPVAIAWYRIPPGRYTLPDGLPRFIMFESDTALLNKVFSFVLECIRDFDAM
jgi:hypothetical protein